VLEDEQLSVLVVDPDPRSLNFLSALLVNAGHNVQAASQGKEGYISALRDRPGIVVFDPAIPDMPAAEFVRKLRADRRTSGALCIALAAVSNSAEMADLLSAGCNEYLVKSPETIEKLVALIAGSHPRVQETQPTAGTTKRNQQGGLLVVFLSAKGGTGTSSLCANIAQNIGANPPPMDIAVLDMVMPLGSIGSIVGYQGEFNLVTAASRSLENLNSQYLRQSLSTLPNWGFRLLAGAPDPESANSIDASHIPVLIRAFRQAFDATFVDLGRSLSRISLPIILEADVVVIITAADLSTVSLTQIMWNYLQQKGLESQRVYMMINRAVGLEGLGKSDVERIVGMQVQATVPYMSGNFTLANNQHLPVLQKMPNDTAAMMLNQISRQVLDLARKAHA
jgi:Flp pilus assembly CpaE family ATPase